jgi:hypothetical protein
LIVAFRGRSLWAMGIERLHLPDWNTLAARDDESLPLLPAALLIASDEYPGLDPKPYEALVQAHADHLRAEVASTSSH